MSEPIKQPNQRIITWQQLQDSEIKEVSYGSVVYLVPDIGLVWITDEHLNEATECNGTVQFVLAASKACGPQEGPPGWYCIAVEETEMERKHILDSQGDA